MDATLAVFQQAALSARKPQAKKNPIQRRADRAIALKESAKGGSMREPLA